MGAMWQQAKRIIVPAGESATFTVSLNCPLERFTIWAVSGRRVLTDMSFQTQINGQNYNAPLTIVALEALDILYRSGGAFSENDLIPFIHSSQRDVLDPFDVSVLITNNSGNDEDVTMFAVGVQHQG